MSEQIDKISSELLDALDKLTNDINRKILQLLLETGEYDIQKLFALFEEHRGMPYLQFVDKIHRMAKSQLLETKIADDGRNIEKVRLTSFGEILLRGLLVAQKLLEAKTK